MASVYLSSVASRANQKWDHALDDLKRMQKAAREDQFGVHSTTDDPEAADVILFVECCDSITHYLELLNHPVYSSHPDKCFLLTRSDIVVPFLPGVYASIPRRWYDPARTRTGFYLDIFDKDFITYESSETPRDYLYSFIGQLNTHPIREAIAELSHPSQFIRDTSPYWPYGELDESTRQRLEERYVDVAQRSRFVLCPRGRGVSSIRLFEMMKMGRAPVIISDEWVPPEGPDWDQFSIRVAEQDVDRIPDILQIQADKAIRMGRKAREVWESWFGPKTCFHRVTEWCLDLKSSPEESYRGLSSPVVDQLMEPQYLRHFLRTAANRASFLRPRAIKQAVRHFF